MKEKIFLTFLALFYFSLALHGDIAWSPPTPISTALHNASDPRIVIDSQGNATAAWIENSEIKASSLPYGGIWSQPVTLSLGTETATKPKLSVDSDGNVTALWIENTSVQTKTLPFGGSWDQEATSISITGASNPVLAVDATGNAVAMWVRNGCVESSTRISGQWSVFTQLSAANSDNPHLAISSCGKAMAAWRSIISGSYTIVTSELTLATNTWGTRKNIFSIVAAHLKDYPKVAIDDYGNATVAWFQYQLLNGNAYQNVQVATSSLSAGAAAWPIPSFLSPSGSRNPADLTIKLRADSKGNVLGVWTNSYEGDTFVIESSLKPHGVTWPRYVQPQVPSLYSFGFDLASTPQTTLMTNMAWDGISGIGIQSQEIDTANPVLQDWSMISPLSTGNGNAYPQCAMCATGSTFTAIAVWVFFDGQNDIIVGSAGTGSAIAPPSNIAAVQDVTDFGVCQDYINTITWEASPDPTVIQYSIFRNGIYFAATDPTALECVDHNSKPGGTVTYGVAAMLSNYRQSEIISYTLFP